MRDVRGKTVLVTGAASGLGRELALSAGREGAVSILVDINPDGLRMTFELLRRMGAGSRQYMVDVSDAVQVESIAEAVRDGFGRLDVLINDAGVFVWADFMDPTPEDWGWPRRVNLWVPILTIHAFLPGMIERRSGHIVNVSSAGGLVTMSTLSACSTAKLGLVGPTETQQHELRPLGISVTRVCPGNIRTPIGDHVLVRGYDRDKLARLAFGLMPRMAPDKAAATVIRGVKKDRSMIILTPTSRLIYALNKLSPGLCMVMRGRPMCDLYWRMRLLPRGKTVAVEWHIRYGGLA